jgi:hypothetical protein
MGKKIFIEVSGKTLNAELNDTHTAKLFYDTLPSRITMRRWGDEYYGDIGLSVETSEDARADMEIGELAIWPDGKALCIFFGPTPSSIDEKPRAISPVNPVGRALDDVSFLKGLPEQIEIEVKY